MCVERNTALQAEDLAYRKSLQKLLLLTSQEQPKLRATPFGRQLPPTPTLIPPCLDAAKTARDAAIRVHQLNSRRSDVPFDYQAEVVDTIVRATIYLARHGAFSFELVDEALILSNYHHKDTETLLSLITSHAGSLPPPEHPILSLDAFESPNVKAPLPDLIPTARDFEHLRDFMRSGIPCVMRSPNAIDQNTLLEALCAAAEVRFVPAESSTDIRCNQWHFGVKKLSLAIANGDYVAQFPLHEHLLLDLTELGVLGGALGPEVQPVVNCWFGPAGTRTPHHTDDYENLYVGVMGFKFFQIIRPTPEISRFLRPLSGSLSNVTSLASDPLRFSSAQLREFGQGNCWNVTVGPGVILYIPRGFWHLAQSLSWHLGLSHWFNAKYEGLAPKSSANDD